MKNKQIFLWDWNKSPDIEKLELLNIKRITQALTSITQELISIFKSSYKNINHIENAIDKAENIKTEIQNLGMNNYFIQELWSLDFYLLELKKNKSTLSYSSKNEKDKKENIKMTYIYSLIVLWLEWKELQKITEEVIKRAYNDMLKIYEGEDTWEDIIEYIKNLNTAKNFLLEYIKQ